MASESQQLMQAIDVYNKGTKAWFEDDQHGWVSGTLLSKEVTETSVKMTFQDDDDDSKQHEFESTLAQLQKTNGGNLPPLRNPPKMENTDDLTNLSYLNEPSVLNTIRTRYQQRNIYTYSGIVLIAANPFDRVPLYEADIIQQYSGRRRGELEPHLFAIAEDAYRCMIREKTNQTIVVSGESGAGKTVSAKYIMRYFATADDDESGKKRDTSSGMTEVEEQILATNPIMEAFGNAKTTRNDNSSRFGKYIEIQFDQRANIVGAKIRTYLLERSRLIFQPETERNYHIFYQLCSGAPLTERKELELKDWTKFHYLNQSGTGVVPNVDDAEEFDLTQRSLSLVGISVQTQWQIFRLLAALLHIGNIEIGGRNDATLSETEPSLVTVTKLLGINPSEFRKWLVRKQIITRSEKIVSNLNPTQATVVRDSVAKYIYASLFDWLVNVVNESLSCHEEGRVATFIGVLDIYGFEHFKKNSFEQFCINYANEKLQQQFNQHVFKLEQEEYVREQIDWKFIDFSDNQKCIEMIEAKLGILSLLDEESRLPSGSDQGFCDKLYANFATPAYKNYFKKPRFSNAAFTVVHYAHDVQYEAEGFIDKNKDTVPDELLNLLQNADSTFLVEMLRSATASAAAQVVDTPKKLNAAKKPTLGSIFKLSLINLMETIGQTNVHYIRCIKPNEAKVAWVFEPNMVLAQLRACGVLETIRISCAGYPSRWTFEDFADRYYALVNSKYWDPNTNPDIHNLCTVILDTYIQDPDKYQVGLTKIFFRAGQLAYMEKLRSDRWNECTILLQKNMRRFIVRLRYLRMKDIAIRLQQIARKKMGVRKLELLRQEKAAIKIQTAWRRYIARKRYLQQKMFTVQLQAVVRGHLARRQFGHFKKNFAATQIQRLIRGWMARKLYHARRDHIIAVQSHVRRRQAQKKLIAMRADARSASHFQEVSYKLESKVVELTQSLTQQKSEKEELRNKASQLETEVKTWMEKYEKLNNKAKELQTALEASSTLQVELQTVQKERDQLQKSYQTSLDKIKKQEDDYIKLSDELSKHKEEITSLRNGQQQQPPQRSMSRSGSGTRSEDRADVMELKNQIAVLKAQLAQSLKVQPKRQQSVNAFSRNLSPAREQRRAMSPESPIPRGRSPTGASVPFRRNSLADSGKSKRDPVGSNRVIYAEPDQMRPMSIDHFNKLRGTEAETNPEEAIHRLLNEDEGFLEEEILEGLIRSLKIIPPNPQNPPLKPEVMFPAHIIGLSVTQMWRYGYLAESERLIFTVMDTIQKYCLSFTGEETIVPCAYWLSNAHELLSLVCSTEQELEREMHYNAMNGRRAVGWHDFEKLVALVKYELQCLEDNIYHHWLTELKKKLSKMAVPAVIENQSLPGFIANDTGRFFGKILSGSSQPAFSMDDLLNFMNQIYRALKCYFAAPFVIEQVLTELLKLIGITTFNDLVMRRNFNSWKRAMQIQYNITRLEEWCKTHEVADATVQLEHLTQAAKLLQLKKSTLEDVKIIYDVCWMLAPTQVQKLIQNYIVADYEASIFFHYYFPTDPISNDILGAVASRVDSGDTNDILLLDNVSLDDSPYEVPEPHTVTANTYLPAFVSLEKIQGWVYLHALLRMALLKKFLCHCSSI
ncbi:P-loop containing nucleoside triphosphate hydrolase protein [Radiomyces spectabilis]|uniref:P-loop containing nucleoside triphosphate hydrolase protein n=1 Tax=Radiomyces spectabilis TaxID=64574 RepID=UPI0022207C21|nr:P-loop containing nucleoside triphosphate hydrolase protein [Radiomyces spectabilis]KAI8390959.1 P-loop containing nucleoside triphosphate hydrolase protein [Radiomyces spectabilis]